MRKTLQNFVWILTGLFLLLSALDFNGEYMAEKALWKINWRFTQAINDPKSYPDAYFDQLLQDYERFVHRFPSSSLVPSAYVFSGRVYTARQDYTKARTTFETVIRQFPSYPQIVAEALIEIGRTYSLEGDYTNALKVYERITKDHLPSAPEAKTPYHN